MNELVEWVKKQIQETELDNDQDRDIWFLNKGKLDTLTEVLNKIEELGQ